MFIKTYLICAVTAVALGIEYPPGIDPAVCPNYPDCDMELLARYRASLIPDWESPNARMVAEPEPVPVVPAVPDWELPNAAVPDWESPNARMVAEPEPVPVVPAVPDWESPNAAVPDWESPNARMVAEPEPVPVVAAVPATVGAVEYPADVDPATCPNYPYCV